MKHTPPSLEGTAGGPPPVEADSIEPGRSTQTGASNFYLGVRSADSAVEHAPKSARVRVTTEFARWVLQTRSWLEQGGPATASFPDARPTWLSYTSDGIAEEDEPFLGALDPSYVQVDREGARWRTVLRPGDHPLETDALCCEELRDLVSRSEAQGRRDRSPIHISRCIPNALVSSLARFAAAIGRGGPAVRTADSKRPARSETHLPREVER